MKTICMLILTLLALAACTASVDRDQYVQWVESYENGLHVKQRVNDYWLDVQYKPADYVALQRIAHSEAPLSVAQARQQVDHLQYYTLTVSTEDPQDDLLRYGTLAEQQRLLYYFSYELQSAIHLEEGQQQLSCVLYHFERSYDLKSTHTFVLGFEPPAVKSTETTLVIAPPLFSSVPVRITLRTSDIPSLTL